MNYELAKELKYAGFYQDGFPSGTGTGCYITPESRTGDPRLPDVIVYEPPLSELIGAIPKDREFFTLAFIRGEWVAGYEKYEAFDPECVGKTPEEAVARLWLALNKHP